jgi:hypothetical protein
MPAVEDTVTPLAPTVSGNKRALSAGLLNWRDRCRARGTGFFSRNAIARPQQLSFRYRQFDSGQAPLQTHPAIAGVRQHFLPTTPFAIPTAPGADLSDRLRARVPSTDAQPPMRDLFRRYLDSRIEVYRKVPDMEASKAELARSAKLQSEIWRSLSLPRGKRERPRRRCCSCPR